MWSDHSCKKLEMLGLVVQSWFSVNLGLKFNSLFQFVYFNASLAFNTCEKKTSIAPGKIFMKEYFQVYKKGHEKFALNFE